MPTKKKANEAQFFFFVSGLPDDTFEVMNFSGTDKISAPYSFNLTLISQQADIAPEKAVNKQATLFIFRDGEYYPYSGIISDFTFMDKSVDRATYAVKLVPKLWLLRLNQLSAMFPQYPKLLQLLL